MHALLILILLLVTLVHCEATSYLFTLEQKVAASKAILKVSVREVAPPKAKWPREPAVCKASVLEVLKGPTDLKEVEFRFHAYGGFSPDKLPQMIGKDYYIFLHEPPLPDRPPNQRWVFEGPEGIRPMGDEYKEYRVVDGKVTTETYSHSNFVTNIRAFVSHPPEKKNK